MSPKSFGCLGIGYILFSFFLLRLPSNWLRPAKIFSLLQVEQKAARRREIKKKKKRWGREEKKFRQLTFIGSHNFINLAKIWERDFEKRRTTKVCVWEHQELKQVERLAGPGLKQCGSTRERCSHGGFPRWLPLPQEPPGPWRWLQRGGLRLLLMLFYLMMPFF